MAIRVPTVEGPSVEQRPLGAPMQRSAATPSLLQQGNTEQLGQIFVKTGQEIQEREDADVLMRAETQVKSKYLEFEAEAKQRKGQNAWGVAKEAGEWWDREAGKISDTLSTPRQRMAFEQSVGKLRGATVGALAGYEAGQRRESLEQAANASIVGSTQLAAANPNNQEILDTARGDIINRAQFVAGLTGMGPEQAKVKMTEHLTHMHEQVIQSLARGDQPDQAADYFAKHQDEIDGTKRAELGKFTATATATKLGERAAEAAWQTAGPKTDRDPAQMDVLDKAIRDDATLSEEAKKVALASVHERVAAFKESRHERDQGMEAKVNAAILNGAGGAQIRRMPEFMAMDGEQQRKLMDFIENRAVRHEQIAAARESRQYTAEARKQTTLAREGFAAYLTYADPEVLAGMDRNQVINLLPSLGNELTGHLMQRFDALQNPAKLAEAKMDNEDFNHVARLMGTLTDEQRMTPDQKANLGELKFRIEGVVASEQQRLKKVFNRTEKMDLMRKEMAQQVLLDSPWYSPSKGPQPAISLSREDVQKVIVPPEHRAVIEAQMLRKFNETGADEYRPTPDNVRRFYLRSRTRAADLFLPPKK